MPTTFSVVSSASTLKNSSGNSSTGSSTGSSSSIVAGGNNNNYNNTRGSSRAISNGISTSTGIGMSVPAGSSRQGQSGQLGQPFPGGSVRPVSVPLSYSSQPIPAPHSSHTQHAMLASASASASALASAPSPASTSDRSAAGGGQTVASAIAAATAAHSSQSQSQSQSQSHTRSRSNSRGSLIGSTALAEAIAEATAMPPAVASSPRYKVITPEPATSAISAASASPAASHTAQNQAVAVKRAVTLSPLLQQYQTHRLPLPLSALDLRRVLAESFRVGSSTVAASLPRAIGPLTWEPLFIATPSMRSLASLFSVTEPLHFATALQTKAQPSANLLVHFVSLVHSLPDTPDLTSVAADLLIHIDRLLKRPCATPLAEDLLACAAGLGRIDVIRSILPFVDTIPKQAFDLAARNSQLAAIKFISTAEGKKYRPSLDGAVASGNMAAVTFICQHFAKSPSSPILPPTHEAVTLALKTNHLDAVKWMLQDRSIWQSLAFLGFQENCVRYGHLDLLKFALRNDIGSVRRNAEGDLLDVAVESGQLEIAEWLWPISLVQRCRNYAIDKAARRGHLAMLKWAHAKQAMTCTHTTMVDAATRGQLEIFIWLWKTFPRERPVTHQMHDVVAVGQFFTLDFFIHNTTDEVVPLISVAISSRQNFLASYISSYTSSKSRLTHRNSLSNLGRRLSLPQMSNAVKTFARSMSLNFGSRSEGNLVEQLSNHPSVDDKHE